ncbi:MAG: acylphosphatase [Gemmatimonadales bacterium]
MIRRFLVHGVVQGVGFRWFAARHGRALGLTGYARNLADGRVEVVAAGPGEPLARLEALLRDGPANARVDRVEREEPTGDPEIPLRSFDIR